MCVPNDVLFLIHFGVQQARGNSCTAQEKGFYFPIFSFRDESYVLFHKYTHVVLFLSHFGAQQTTGNLLYIFILSNLYCSFRCESNGLFH